MNLLRGIVAGLAGGLVGSWAMSECQKLWRLNPRDNQAHAERSKRRQPKRNVEQAAVSRLAVTLAAEFFHDDTTSQQEKAAGLTIHYILGAAMGTVYGAVGENTSQITAGTGLLWGTAIWLVGDETVVPLIGLSKPLGDYPFSEQLQTLASHLVYGLTNELTRRFVVQAIGRLSMEKP